MSTTAKVLSLYGKSRDANTVCVTDSDGNEIVLADGDYIPYGLGIGGGDYIELEIDIETGKIVGWDYEAFKSGLAELLEERRREEEDEDEE